MEPLLNADLHCHSVVSDGTLTPEALAARAKANGVQLWALTDHDEIGGQERAIASAKALDMKYLTGVEISITFAGKTVHIVGLGFDHTHTDLVQGLRNTRGGRAERAKEMSDGLAKVGIQGPSKAPSNMQATTNSFRALTLLGSWLSLVSAKTRLKCFANTRLKINLALYRTAGLHLKMPFIGLQVPVALPSLLTLPAMALRPMKSTHCSPNLRTTAAVGLR